MTHSTLHHWHDDEVTGVDLLRPEDVGKPLAATLAGHHRHAILILDARGVVRFATTRHLFGRPDHELPELHLQSLIPTLPVRSGTPGYNVAYVRLAFADQSWQPHQAVAADGAVFPIEVSVRTLPIGRSYALLAAVRECVAHARPHGGVRRSYPAGALLAA